MLVFNFPPPKDFGEILFWRCPSVRSLSVRPSVRTSSRPSVMLFYPDGYLGNGFSDFIVILQEYVLAYEDGSHQVSLHCTNWK